MHVFNDKVVTLVIGSPGSGKSTFASMLAYEADKKNIPCYCNYPVKGTYLISLKNIYEYNLGKSVLIIDEAGLEYFSRNIKAFTAQHNDWYSTTRHRRTQIFVIVQAWSRVDVILRNLGTEALMCKKWPFGLTRIKVFASALDLVQDRDGNATEFKDIFKYNGSRFFWRPKYYHMFDSYYLAREYREPDFPLSDDICTFPVKLPLWRRIFGIYPKEPPADLSASGSIGHRFTVKKLLFLDKAKSLVNRSRKRFGDT